MTRIANFSSSSVWKLTKTGRGKDEFFGTVALDYIAEKRMESKLGVQLGTEYNAWATNWGILVESIAFNKLPIDYELISDIRYSHSSIPNWTGMGDIRSADTSGDIKCPWTRKSFCKLVDVMREGAEALKNNNLAKDDGHKYYWQIVSNCILTGKANGSLSVYCPYKEDLINIRTAAAGWVGDENMSFINHKSDDELPYLIKGNHYKDINSMVFEVPKEDIEFLEHRVQEAVKLLTKIEVINAT